jgi:hypothetical protein
MESENHAHDFLIIGWMIINTEGALHGFIHKVAAETLFPLHFPGVVRLRDATETLGLARRTKGPPGQDAGLQ